MRCHASDTAELKALVQDRHEAHRRPAVEELGALDLGLFADRDELAADDGGMAEAATATS